MWKYFVETKRDYEDAVDEWRKVFPGHHFKGGKWKGKSGIYIIRDLKKKTYGEPTGSCLENQLKNKGIAEGSVIFWPPESTEDFNIEAHEIDNGLPKIRVQLECGEMIKINPAIGEPRKLLFGIPQEPEKYTQASLYPQSTDYGKVAYSLCHKELDEKLYSTDPELLVFTELALVASYTMKQDMWNWLGWVDFPDIIQIYKAGMGANDEYLKAVGVI